MLKIAQALSLEHQEAGQPWCVPVLVPSELSLDVRSRGALHFLEFAVYRGKFRKLLSPQFEVDAENERSVKIYPMEPGSLL